MLTVPAAGDYLFQLETRRGCDAGGSETYAIRIDGAPDQVFSAPCDERETKRAPMRVHFDDARPRAFTLELAHQSARAGDVTFTWQAPVAALRDQAVAVAADADTIVAFVGVNAWLEGEAMPPEGPGFEGGDRTSIALPKAQRDLLDALEATGKPVVIVLQSGSAVALGENGRKANAILEAWYPGEKGGQAIAEVLRGTVNPSGRLPEIGRAHV